MPRPLLLVLIASVAGATDSSPDCPFDCFNDSVCGTCDGNKLFGDIEICRNGFHCECPPGWSGLRCARPFESCYDDQLECYNGGKCIEGLTDIYGNDQYFCDCSEARDEDGNRMVGKFCHIKGIDMCDDSGDKFCVNGANCLTADSATDLKFCDCGDMYEGQHCEFDKGKVPECVMECENGGECTLGVKNYVMAVLGYNGFWKNHEKAMYCSCPKGFYGLKCDVPANKCGDFECFNGAQCLIDQSSREYFCDCSTIDSSTTAFAGKYCQYEATSFCDKTDDIDGQAFCVNGGKCREDGPGCNCTEPWDGALCEFNKTIDKDASECTLACENDGICHKGVKDMSFLDITNVTHDGRFQHCLCKTGFFGLTCDIKVQMCGDGAHVCLNGGVCNKNGDNWVCDCDQAPTPNSRYAGAFCQHEASVYCTADGKPGSGADANAFCTNGGTCKGIANGKGHPGCTCPDHMKGENCQYPLGSVEGAITKEFEEGKSSAGVEVFVAVFFSVVGVLALAIYVMVRRRRKQKEQANQEIEKAMSAPTPTSKLSFGEEDLDFGPEKDHEGNELDNVEII